MTGPLPPAARAWLTVALAVAILATLGAAVMLA